MNTTLFRSRHAVAAGLFVAAFAAYSLAREAPFGRVAGMDRGFLVASGWGATLLLLVVFAYVLRKYAHRGGYSPEFARRVDFAALERAEKRVNALRQRILDRSLDSRAAVQGAADGILKSEKVARVQRAIVEPGFPGGDPWRIRLVPTEPLGRVATWMHAHLFYGLAFGVLLWMHSGFVVGSLLGSLLVGLGLLVWLTGLVGIVLWAKGPTWLTRAERDLSIEEAHALSQSLSAKRAAAIAALAQPTRGRVEAIHRDSSQSAGGLQRAVQDLVTSQPDRAAELKDVVALIQQERTVKSELAKLTRVRSSFMSWKLVHIPAALVLAGALVLHVLAVWKY